MAKNIETDILLKKLSGFKYPEITKSTQVNEEAKSSDATKTVLCSLKSDWIQSVIGYFINHRSHSEYANINNEYKIQDLLYCQLSTILEDLQFEDPNAKNRGAISFTIGDFISKKNRILIEAKFISSAKRAKVVESEISEDIIKYGKQKKYKSIIFFIYCSSYAFPNRTEFELGFTDKHELSGFQFDTFCIVKP